MNSAFFNDDKHIYIYIIPFIMKIRVVHGSEAHKTHTTSHHPRIVREGGRCREIKHNKK